jgi:hypothetical protein
MAKPLTAKFKNLRKTLRSWQKNLSGLKKNNGNVKNVLSFLEIIEEFRDLSEIEWNFTEKLSLKLKQLLDQQRTYWKQRGKVKWIKEGDANTKLFHATASVKHRNNLISCLQKNNGETVVSHTEKEIVLWEAFKDRLGQYNFTCISSNLNHFLVARNDLEWLEAPFSKEEIDVLIKGLPNNKAPGPDGFNNEFIKHC